VVSVSILYGLLFLSVAVGTAATILAWRVRSEPGAKPLVALLLGQSWWSTCLIFRLQATTVDAKLLWTDLAWPGVVIIPVAWLLFSLEYTGRDEYIRSRYVALLTVVPAITVVLALTTPFHDLLYARPLGFSRTGVFLVAQGGPWYWVIAAYTYLLGLGGIIPLLGLLTSDAVTFRGQSTALILGLSVPWLTNVLFLADVFATSGIDPTPVAFSVSGVAYLGALTRFRLFGTSPAPNKRARKFLFDRMQDGALVVDMNGYVVEVNDSCVDLLGTAAPTLLGAPAADVIPDYEQFPDEGSLPGHLLVGDTAGGQPYDVTVTPITNVRGDTIGRVVTFHDIGEHLRQQQRLTVLNRVLRHNIRTETNLIHGYVDQFADDDDAEIVKQRALRIEELGKKGRDAIELFDKSTAGRTPRPLASLLDRAVSTVRTASPAATISVPEVADDVFVAGLLDVVFTNLLENAVEHNPADEPHVSITVTTTADRVVVEVADDGPGIEDYELRVLRDGTETPLDHGSGLGLWLVQWGVEIADGWVKFATEESRGTVVTVDVPRLSAPSSGP
jgi:signal transduction histidine kinase